MVTAIIPVAVVFVVIPGTPSEPLRIPAMEEEEVGVEEISIPPPT